MKGKKESLLYMQEYNNKDVEILEQVFLKLYPYIKSTPNISLYQNDIQKACTKCGATTLIKDKFYYTKTGKYQLYKCTKCGSFSRERFTLHIGDRHNLLTTI